MGRNVLLIAAVVVVAVIGIGGFLLASNKLNLSGTDTAENEGETSVADLLAQNVSLECNYNDPEKGMVTAYIKDGKVRANYTDSEGKSGNTLIRDNKMYFWDGENAFMMDITEEDMENAIDKVEESPTGQNPQDIMDKVEEYRQYCNDRELSDSLFDLPSGVGFQDFSQYMQGTNGGVETPNPLTVTPSQEEIQRLMEQSQEQ